MVSAGTAQLTTAYRRANLVLRSQTLRDLRVVWSLLKVSDLDRSFPALLRSVSALVERDRERAAGLAANYTRAVRLADGIPGHGAVVLAESLPREQVEASLHATTVAAARRSLGAGMAEGAAMENALVTAAGSVGRMVLNAGRATVVRSVFADLRGKGWERVASGSACQFCRLLAGRGSVYTEESVEFNAHDHCACSAEPVYA